MTNAQKWIMTVLLLFVVLSIITWVTYDNEPNTADNYSQTENNNSNVDNEGLVLATKIGCANCHGSDLKGSGLAPSLVEVKKYWNRDELINYLRNPSSFGNNERITEYKEKYRSVMPAYNNIDVKELGKIADYIIKLK
ncbi:MAG TPA: cytochrome c [Melioribacteraceae bacterium]|nr:cytochrome c [Melioribacteraceae bacterium]